jgi:hypothetical protein
MSWGPTVNGPFRARADAAVGAPGLRPGLTEAALQAESQTRLVTPSQTN